MNQNNNICPLCGNDTKIVPPGVSKRTGKAYQAFVSCTNMDCKFTSKVPNPVPIIPDGTPTGTPIGTQTQPKTQPETQPEMQERISEVMVGLRKIYKKLNDIETKLVDKAMCLDDIDRKLDELKL